LLATPAQRHRFPVGALLVTSGERGLRFLPRRLITTTRATPRLDDHRATSL
jgi:hypothetical protein